jgi:hypothetical protein
MKNSVLTIDSAGVVWVLSPLNPSRFITKKEEEKERLPIRTGRRYKWARRGLSVSLFSSVSLEKELLAGATDNVLIRAFASSTGEQLCMIAASEGRAIPLWIRVREIHRERERETERQRDRERSGEREEREKRGREKGSGRERESAKKENTAA